MLCCQYTVGSLLPNHERTHGKRRQASTGFLLENISVIVVDFIFLPGLDRERLGQLWTQVLPQVIPLCSRLILFTVRSGYALNILQESDSEFPRRYAHLAGDPKEESPVIDQFLECVWQLSEQFPCAFEFNEHFLIAIRTHVYSCHFGNFLGNCPKERRNMRWAL